MFRQISGYLNNWLTRRDRKPMLLRGARQVGKTWVIRELAKANSLPLIEINFELRPEFKKSFAHLDPTLILHSLELMGVPKIIAGKCILFFDEIQECPVAIMALRYFYEQMPKLAVIGTGSLLEFALNKKDFSWPVGRIESAWLYPMNFCEYLIAIGNEGLAKAISQNPFHSKLPMANHEHTLKELRTYLFCGGMPEAVKALVEKNGIESIRRVHRSILQTFRLDFYKYAGKIKSEIAETLFTKAPGLVAGRFKYSHLDSELRSSELKPAVDALENAGVIRRVVHTSGQGLPFAADANPRITKLIFLDVGLMHASLQIDAEWIQSKNLLGIHCGAVAEQYVAQELLSNRPPDHEPELFFWVREALNSQAEVDYLVALKGKVIPIEVKAGSSGTLKSLNLFLESHPNSNKGIRFYEGFPIKEGKIHHLPLYTVCSLV